MESKVYIIPEYVWGAVTVAQEASSEPYIGKVAVAEVIRDRTENKLFSNGTVMSTVLWPYQFSGWNSKDPNRIRVAQYELTNPKMIECIKAFQEAYLMRTNYARGATHYHASTLNPYPNWASDPSFLRLVDIGNHIFYKEIR